MPKDVIVQTGIVGDYTEDNIKLISKKQGIIYLYNICLETKQSSFLFILQFLLIGKNVLSENIWEAMRLVCFENKSSSNSKLKVCKKVFLFFFKEI